MRKQYVSFIIALIFCTSSGVCLAQTDAQFTLDECLRVLLDDENAPQLVEHDFQLILPGEAMPRVMVGLSGTQIDYFDCPKFSLEQSFGSGNLEMVFTDGRPRRGISALEKRGLRWYLSLNPFWVLHEVKNRLHEFEYSSDPESGLGYFTYEKTIPLSHQSQKLFGLYREELVVDINNHTVLTYTMQALDPDLQPLKDLHNIFQYDQSPGPSHIAVTQGPTADIERHSSFRVLY